ncbi:hypothetical protein BCR39DRAFT_339804 [Naematelia encephala]|uniref:F-box domain-containing protein n=1 Tax=Naematelia encephala TaxID=71784 RepID=A0A1Y2ANF3_9TREE|nr:hypothetical protein BCR39DRAFT_339804 [Naematelia encephala]
MPQLYRFPGSPAPIDFESALLALEPELLTRILLYLSPDDLCTLSRVVPDFIGIEDDEYLRMMWFSRTLPARVGFALFSPLRGRPDPKELVRRGTLRGIAIISGVRSMGYWSSESAVRLSRIHQTLHLQHVKRTLDSALAPSHRPAAAELYRARILPLPSTSTAPRISAGAHVLAKAQEKDEVRRALLRGLVGVRTIGQAIERWGLSAFGGESERVRWAVCPGIKEKRIFWETLATRA